MPVSLPKSNKKQRTEASNKVFANHKFKTSIRIEFKKLPKAGTNFNVSSHVKQVILEMMKADSTISVLSLDKKSTYCPSHDDFPASEEKFKAYFLVHPAATERRTVTVGCILRSSKTVGTIKFDNIEPTPVIEWLRSNKIFIEADTLGHHVTRIVGHLLRVHPKITHRATLKDILETELRKVKITPEEVIALDPSAQSHYQQAMDSGDDADTFVPPFELIVTSLGSGPADNRVSTDVMGIKTNASHQSLLRELFSRLFTNPPADLGHIQFSLSGIASVIGYNEYLTLLRENNKFFASLATIPIDGIDDTMLELDIRVADPKVPDKKMSLRDVFLNQTWCLQVEPTEKPGKIILVTTKAQLSVGRKWIDDNFESLFKVHLPRNPRYQQSTSTTVPRRTDRIHTSASMANYAETLRKTIASLPSDPKSDKKYSRLPFVPKRGFRCIYDQDFPELPPAKSKASTNSTQTQISNLSIASSNTTQTSTQNSQAIDLTTIKEEVRQSLLGEFNEILRQELANMKKDLQTQLSSLASSTSSKSPDDSQSSPTSQFNDMLKQELQAMRTELQEVRNLRAEFQEAQNSNMTLYQSLQKQVNMMEESLKLLHQQIQSCHQKILLIQPSPQGRGDGRP